MVTSVKSVAKKATLVAAAALAAAPMGASAAQASSISGIFLYRSRDTAVSANCTGGNHLISNKGNVNLGKYYIFENESFSSSTVGVFLYSRWVQIAATTADKQEWCYDNDVDYQYYAGKVYHRTISQDYICSGGCQFLGNFYGAWEAGF
jgi:hypothetical protein